MTGNDVTRAKPGNVYIAAVRPYAVNINALCAYLGCGKNKAYETGAAAGALFRAGRRNLYVLDKIDAYVNDHLEERKLP